MSFELYRKCSLKKAMVFAFIFLALHGIVMQRFIHAEGQTRFRQTFFDSVAPIKMKDPLAVLLGAINKDDVFVFTYADAVKFAGHSCPAVAGAYKSTQIALKNLYGEDVPVRGNIQVALEGGTDTKVNGPVSHIVTLITGAAPESGFKGFGEKGIHGRYNLMTFDLGKSLNPTATCSMIFQRIDNGKIVKITYFADNVPMDKRAGKLMPLVISGKASGEEVSLFGDLMQERVKTILLNPPEGTFVVSRQ
ncbi:MAG: hypothetical protein MRJ65_13105 [Candidatus Brocadiaceae bacterium]|nr:hypothetical protein [Candidatus Brocadiaceae bacterium]